MPKENKKITIIGCGPGAIDLITIKGKNALENADVVIGSKRLIDDFVQNSSVKILLLENNYQEILDQAAQILKKNKKLVFLVSGDPLFYSYGESVIKKFGEENCEIIPGISSVQYGFSKLKKSWKEYNFLTLHGVKDFEIQKIFEENEKFILLLDPKNNLKLIKNKLESISEYKYEFHILSNLSLPAEKILNISIEDFDNIKEESLSILVVKRLSISSL